MGIYNPLTGDRGNDYESLTEAEKLQRLWDIDRAKEKQQAEEERAARLQEKAKRDPMEKERLKREIMGVKDVATRQRLIKENPHLFR